MMLSDRARAFASEARGMGFELPPLVFSPPAWSPDAAPSTVLSVAQAFLPQKQDRPVPPPSSWGTGTRIALVAGGVATLTGLGILAWFLSGRRARPATTTPTTAVRANRVRSFSKGGRRWSVR